jgi:hypothetical protein
MKISAFMLELPYLIYDGVVLNIMMVIVNAKIFFQQQNHLPHVTAATEHSIHTATMKQPHMLKSETTEIRLYVTGNSTLSRHQLTCSSAANDTKNPCTPPPSTSSVLEPKSALNEIRLSQPIGGG